MTASDANDSDTEPLDEKASELLREIREWCLSFADHEGRLPPEFADRVLVTRRAWQAWEVPDKHVVAKTALELLELHVRKLNDPSPDLEARIAAALPHARLLQRRFKKDDPLARISPEDWAEAMAQYRPLQHNVPGVWTRAPRAATAIKGRPAKGERAQSTVLYVLLSSAGLTGCSTSRDFWQNLQKQGKKTPAKKQ